MEIELLGRGHMGSVHASCYEHLGVKVARQTGRIDPSELLKDASIDAVDVCFPSEVHKDFVVAALNNGKHVFCETPFALTMEDADEMINAAKRNEKILMVGLLMRSIAEYQEIAKIIKEGSLGKIKEARAFRLANYMTPGSQAHKDHYGDAISELMTFDFDYLNSLFGLPSEVSATGKMANGTDKIGEVQANAKYGDVQAFVEASSIKPLDFPFTVGVEITGENGSLKLHTVFEGEMPTNTFTITKNGQEEKINVEGHNPYEYELKYFLDCIQGKADPNFLSAERAREALEVVLATREAVISQKPQQI